jgi:hypothetical protein
MGVTSSLQQLCDLFYLPAFQKGQQVGQGLNHGVGVATRFGWVLAGFNPDASHSSIMRAHNIVERVVTNKEGAVRRGAEAL